MAIHTRGPDDLPERRAIRFGLRGKNEIVDCYVSWDALDAFEGGPAATRAERLARFEMHRPIIEAAAVAKCQGSGAAVSIDANDLKRMSQS